MRFLPVVCFLSLAAMSAVAAENPTFSKDVAPILNERCVSCHRSGEAAPMSLRTYTEARPWAKSIKAQVASRTMPPWHAEPGVNKFANDRRLSDAEVATIVKWVDAGAPEGNPADLPKPSQFIDGWNFGKPDMVFDSGVDFKIPASGVVPYQFLKVDPGFKEDTWVQAVEVRPTQRAQVHHILVFVQDGEKGQTRGGEQFSNMLIGYAPGVPTITWDKDTAFLVKAGSTFLFQVHYTVNGKEASDRSVLGLKIRKDAPKYQAFSGSAMNPRLNIPPGEANYQISQTFTFREDTTLLDLTPHMHLRGKAFKYVLTYPDGRSEVLLNVPHYEFNWQLSYILAEPRQVPAGSKIEATAWYDNSPANKYNPDPTKAVHWGDQTWEEMMIGFFNYKVPLGQTAPPPLERRPSGGNQ
jgi:hypothetical protein